MDPEICELVAAIRVLREVMAGRLSRMRQELGQVSRSVWEVTGFLRRRVHVVGPALLGMAVVGVVRWLRRRR